MLERPVRDISGGFNQTGVRDHNERLVMSTIQRHGALPGSEIARRTGLSPQTVSVILRQLEADHFIQRGAPQRGRVGKPSIPMALNPDGVLSVGMKIGRRSADLVLVDFLGRMRLNRQITYRYPLPDRIFEFLRQGLDEIGALLAGAVNPRIAGIGIAAPFELWNWHEILDAPEADVSTWRDIDFATEIARFSDLPVVVENDATAACRAEHIYGRGPEFRDYGYFFVGSFIGGGVVINHSVYEGTQGNAGAFGSLPISQPGGEMRQLIDMASIHGLEESLTAAGLDPRQLWSVNADWQGFDPILDAWIETTGRNIAIACLMICGVIDFEAVLIDGGFPARVREMLVARTREALGGLDSRGLILPRIEAAQIGGNARALGAASGPVFSQYLLNTNTR